MKRFHVFASHRHFHLGYRDYRQSFETVEEAREDAQRFCAAGERYLRRRTGWYEIMETLPDGSLTRVTKGFWQTGEARDQMKEAVA